MYRVEILLSSYNGEKYIMDQIDSIFSQEKVNIHLTIRDDGSEDKTEEVIKQAIRKYGKRKIKFIKGKNIGYKKSFINLLKEAKDADYYAFSDQDDIWEDIKIIEAIRKLIKSNEKNKLYVSALTIIDENKRKKKITKIGKIPNSLESYFARGRYAGCTYVFTKSLLIKASKLYDINYDDYYMPSHDFLLCTCAYIFGRVIIDEKSYILHIRHKESVTATFSIAKRIRIEFNSIFKSRYRSVLANEIISKYGSNINHKDFLINSMNYKGNITSKINLIKNSNMNTGNVLFDLESLLRIILNLY